MKINKFIKKVQIITYLFCIMQIAIVVSMSVIANAETEGDKTFKNISDSVDKWEQMGKEQQENVGVDTDSALTPVLSIAQILTYAGFFVVVGAASWVGFKWLLSKNLSDEAQTKLKRQTIGLVIAACVLLGARKLWQTLIEGLDSIT